MTTKRPTAAQLDVLRKMADGWRLVDCSRNFRTIRAYRAFPEKGRPMTVPISTFDVIEREGLVEKDPRYCDDYRLTPAGLAASQQ